MIMSSSPSSHRARTHTNTIQHKPESTTNSREAGLLNVQ
jgi:hypothetical protein